MALKFFRNLFGAQSGNGSGVRKIPLYLSNTLSGEKEIFTPLSGKTVRMYNCGPTVYNFVHIGNLRAYIFADTLRRALEWNGYEVRQVINITDVGHLTSDADEGTDKLEAGAQAQHRSVHEIVRMYTDAFFADLAALNVVHVSREPKKITFPRATDCIKEQIDLIATLEKIGQMEN